MQTTLQNNNQDFIARVPSKLSSSCMISLLNTKSNSLTLEAMWSLLDDCGMTACPLCKPHLSTTCDGLRPRCAEMLPTTADCSTGFGLYPRIVHCEPWLLYACPHNQQHRRFNNEQ